MRPAPISPLGYRLWAINMAYQIERTWTISGAGEAFWTWLKKDRP